MKKINLSDEQYAALKSILTMCDESDKHVENAKKQLGITQTRIHQYQERLDQAKLAIKIIHDIIDSRMDVPVNAFRDVFQYFNDLIIKFETAQQDFENRAKGIKADIAGMRDYDEFANS